VQIQQEDPGIKITNMAYRSKLNEIIDYTSDAELHSKRNGRGSMDGRLHHSLFDIGRGWSDAGKVFEIRDPR